MRRRGLLFVAGVLLGVIAAMLVPRIREAYFPPASWTALQQWAATAKVGALYTGNTELGDNTGVVWKPLLTQKEPCKFLFSDSPEYLYKDSVGKALASMRLSNESDPGKVVKFGVGLHHINKAGRPLPVQVVVRLLAKVDGKTNSRPATIHLTKGAYGLTDKPMEIYAGKACSRNWYVSPNVKPAAFTIKPGQACAVFTKVMSPAASMNAMFDLETDNAYFVKVYTIFGEVRDYEHVAYAPYGMTIGTASGEGPYWKRIFTPMPGTPAFDAADTRHANKVHFRFSNTATPPGRQYLTDESWDLRPENGGKALVRRKGGQRRPYKGDYNVEFTVTIPVRSSTGKPATFAVIDTQRYGMFAGAIRHTDGSVVLIPGPPAELLNKGNEGVLIDRVTVSSKAPISYTFQWLLPGGSYGDQDFLLVPLGEIK